MFGCLQRVSGSLQADNERRQRLLVVDKDTTTKHGFPHLTARAAILNEASGWGNKWLLAFAFALAAAAACKLLMAPATQFCSLGSARALFPGELGRKLETLAANLRWPSQQC